MEFAICPISICATYDDAEEYNLANENPAIIHNVGDFKTLEKRIRLF